MKKLVYSVIFFSSIANSDPLMHEQFQEKCSEQRSFVVSIIRIFSDQKLSDDESIKSWLSCRPSFRMALAAKKEHEAYASERVSDAEYRQRMTLHNTYFRQSAGLSNTKNLSSILGASAYEETQRGDPNAFESVDGFESLSGGE